MSHTGSTHSSLHMKEDKEISLIKCPSCNMAEVIIITCQSGANKGKEYVKCPYNVKDDPKSCQFFWSRSQFEKWYVSSGWDGNNCKIGSTGKSSSIDMADSFAHLSPVQMDSERVLQLRQDEEAAQSVKELLIEVRDEVRNQSKYLDMINKKDVTISGLNARIDTLKIHRTLLVFFPFVGMWFYYV